MTLLLALLLQAAVFEDRDTGTSIEVSAGWQLSFNDTEGRVILKRMDDPGTFARVDVRDGKNDEVGAGKWDGYLERFQDGMAAKLPGFAMKKTVPSLKDGIPALELWYSAGEGETAVTGFFRVMAYPERLLILSAAARDAKWESVHETIEATLRSTSLQKPQAGAGAVWTDRKNGFSIAVPPKYRVRPEKRGNLVVNLTAPEGVANMNVVVRGPDPSFEAERDDLKATLEPQLAKAYPGFAYVEFEKVDWNGLWAIKTAGTFTKGDLKLANMQFGVSTDNRSYYLTWTCPQAAFKDERTTFEASLRSFKVLEPK